MQRTLREVTVPDGRTVAFDDTGSTRSGVTVVWHHESPHTGALYDPLPAIAAAHDVRLVALARPGYGTSSPLPERSVADAAGDLFAVLDVLGIDGVAVVGGSGGGPHALAAAALRPDRVTGCAVLASPAPFVDDDAWWGGMVAPGGLRAAMNGREARIAFASTDRFDPSSFVDADYGALRDAWGGLARDVDRATAGGVLGLVDDDVAFTRPWGVDLARITAPTIVVQGALDRVVPPAHGRMLADLVPRAELWERAGDGHVSVLSAVSDTFARLAATNRG